MRMRFQNFILPIVPKTVSANNYKRKAQKLCVGGVKSVST